MASLADFQRSSSEGLEVSHTEERSQEAVDDVVLVQDATGNFLSFSWSGASQYNIKPERVLGNCGGEVFSPVDIVAYREKIKQVFSHLSPERFRCYFRSADHSLLFDLVMSPVLLPEQLPKAVIVAGRLIDSFARGEATPCGHLEEIAESESTNLIESAANPYVSFSPSSDRYQKLLTQIAWNISRTLDLETVQQQTVQGLGKSLGVNQCIFCDYDPRQSARVQVVAEYSQDPFPSFLNVEFWVAEIPYLKEAIQTLKPVSVQKSQTTQKQGADAEFQPRSMLVIATSDQERPNGLIVLYQYDRDRLWSEAELELIQNLADQVGTTLAHAKLLSKSQQLATELQKANSSLLQKHRELEEARHQAEEASRLKSEFLANTSHELRTPLNGMIGFLKLVIEEMTDNPEEEADFINEAYNSALHLNNILSDVLDLAKIEAGKLQIDLTSVNLDVLLGEVERFAQGHAQIRQKSLYFEIQTPPTNDEIILFGDYQRLKQVMFNLVGNAIKFTHEGGITVSVEVIKKKVTVQDQELPGMVKVRVADTGIGVSLDMQDRLFQSFSQVDGSRTRQYGGTGLGLAISQKLVEAMGGVVNFYSMGEGLGSTVTFTVPLYQEPIL